LLGLGGQSETALGASIPTVTFSVKRFTIAGDNPLSEQRTTRLLAPFMGKQEGLNSLLKAAATLEVALAEAGHHFHRVVLLPQTLRGGTVKLQVSQIRIASVEVTGNTFFSAENVAASVPGAAVGKVPGTRQLARQLQVANKHPSKRLALRIRHSQTADSVDAVLEVQDRRPWQVFSLLNNAGNRSTGRFRLTAGGQHSNVLGLDHTLTGRYTTSPGHISDVKQWGLSYRIPIYPLAGETDFFYSRSGVDSARVQNVFGVSGAGRFMGVSYTHIFLNEENYAHRLRVGVKDKYFENNVSYFGAPIGVDLHSRAVTLSYFGEYRIARSQFDFDIAYSTNLPGGRGNKQSDYSASRAGASRRWDALRYNDSVLHSIDAQCSVRLALSSQYSNEPLISGEQFGIGGVGSIRGFAERVVSGDRGNQLSLQVSHHIVHNLQAPVVSFPN
jgi:hemolysin activation/secretion protein